MSKAESDLIAVTEAATSYHFDPKVKEQREIINSLISLANKKMDSEERLVAVKSKAKRLHFNVILWAIGLSVSLCILCVTYSYKQTLNLDRTSIQLKAQTK